MATIDPTVATDRIKLAVGDVSDIPYLTEEIYQYCLDIQNNNEPAATRMAAQMILAQLAYGSHQRLDKIEQWGSESFNNYLTYIKQVISNPSLNATGGVYVGGMNLVDVQANIQDTTIVQKRIINYPTDSYDDSTENLYGVVTEDNNVYF